MSMKVFTLALLQSVVSAQQAVWSQCGGQGWNGVTSCVSGSACTYSNDWYSQCVPVTGGSTTKASTTLSTITTRSNPITSSSTSNSGKPVGVGYQYLISFGDSYTQTGFEISGTKPSSSNILGNPSFPGYTTSGGANWLGYLITKYNHSTILTYNFASGGATTDSALIPPYASTVLSLVDQVSQFSKNLASKPSYAPWTSSNTLFTVWIGVNDVGNVWSRSDFSSFAQTVINRYMSQVQILYNAGGRSFAFLSVPPIQRTPSVLTQPPQNQQQEGAAVITYNKILATAVDNFKAKNNGVKAVLVDTVSPFNTALNNPTAYGAKDATCYNSDGKTCLWWNDYHPGLRIQELVAKAVAGAVSV